MKKLIAIITLATASIINTNASDYFRSANAEANAFFHELERARQVEDYNAQIRQQQFQHEEMQRNQRRIEEGRPARAIFIR